MGISPVTGRVTRHWVIILKLTFIDLTKIFLTIVKIYLRYLVTTFKLSVLCIVTELSSLTVVTDATACLVAVELEDLTVVIVVFCQPASHLADVEGFVAVSDISHVLLSEQIYYWF